jgi:hypothetical protein
MTDTYWVRMNAETTEVQAKDRAFAIEKAVDEFNTDARFDLEPHHIDHVEEVNGDDFNELYTDVHVTLTDEGDWTGELVIRSNEDSEYDREVIREIDLVDEAVLFGLAVHGDVYGTFEKRDVTVWVRGGIHEGEECCSVQIVENHRDL